MTDIDAFAGPGGWSVAKAKLGRKGKGIELDPTACATARAAGHYRIPLDVSKLDPRGALAEGPVELMTQSPPCTEFSMSGSGRGQAVPEILGHMRMIARGRDVDETCAALQARLGTTAALVLEPLRWAIHINPETIALEQVPRALPAWEAIAAALRLRGYSTWTGVLEAQYFEVPQVRLRAVMIASRVIEVHRPHAFSEARSMASVIGWGMTHRPSYTVTSGGVDTGGAEPIGNGARKGMRRERDAGRWIEKPGGGMTLSVAEAATLQGFPADYPWQGNKGQQYRQIGNAIPPPLAWHVLRAALGLPAEPYPAN